MPRLGYTDAGRTYVFTEEDILWYKELHQHTGMYTFDCKTALANAKGDRKHAVQSLLNAYPSHGNVDIAKAARDVDERLAKRHHI